jgi:hypothetical protein
MKGYIRNREILKKSDDVPKTLRKRRKKKIPKVVDEIKF